MKQKRPWLAALLNVIFPGVGFVYLSKAFYITGGIILILLSVIGFLLLLTVEGTGGAIVFIFFISLFYVIALAAIGYESARQINLNIEKSIQNNTEPTTELDIHCANCGFENPIDSIFCIKCGNKLGR